MADDAGNTIVVHANFLEDLRLSLLNLLTAAGAPVPAAQQNDVFAVCRAYFNVAHKVIQPKRRAVLYSQELRRKASNLAPDLWAGVQLIETRSTVGEPLEEHLSERARRSQTHDWLLNDWGIHHLHVRPGRGSELLYVWTTDDALRFIDLRDHNAMADVDLLEIVLSDWPEQLEPYQLRGMRGSYDGSNPSAKELNEARRAGVQPLVTLSNGKLYAPRGGGLTTAGGSSGRAVSDADHAMARARDREHHCRRAAKAIARTVGRNELRLRYDITTDTAVEVESGERIGFEDQR